MAATVLSQFDPRCRRRGRTGSVVRRRHRRHPKGGEPLARRVSPLTGMIGWMEEGWVDPDLDDLGGSDVIGVVGGRATGVV